MRTTDNNGGIYISQFDNSKIKDLSVIANKNLLELQKDNTDLLVFPHTFGQYSDDVEKMPVFFLDEEKLTTNNLMGFIGRNETQLTITSRFAKEDTNDYFLHYMLQKVFSINLLNLDQTTGKENIWDFLLYLFPYYLKKAHAQGIYKAYKKEEYNDANIKGAINIKQHILKNTPFSGKIAYTTRELSYNNNITQLIRHTIEKVKSHTLGNSILNSNAEMRDIINKFIFVTNQSYSLNARQKVIAANIKPVVHPYYTEYTALQKICLQILRQEKITYGKNKDKIFGLLFDGAWLWEEYLNTVLKEKFIHPENKTGAHRHYLFENFQPIYPDFISKDKPTLVGDAKYIPLDKQQSYTESSERASSIYYKTIAYMYRFTSQRGFLLFPSPNVAFFKSYKIKETNGILQKIGLAIPQSSIAFKDYIIAMEKNEKKMLLTLMNEAFVEI